MSSFQLLKKEECLGKMEQELDARTRELNRTQEELVTSNQISSDLNQQLEELQRHCSTLKEQRFLLGLWGLWERCWCTIAIAHPTCPHCSSELFLISVLAKTSAFVLRPSMPSQHRHKAIPVLLSSTVRFEL